MIAGSIIKQTAGAAVSENLIAFLALLLFFLGVLKLMSNPKRVLNGTEKYGSRALLVDAQGEGQFTTIQAALDAAYSQTPAADARWLVLVAPGEYQEALTPYDYVDIAGLGAGGSAHLVSPSNQPAVTNAAACTISNLRISGENDPLISCGGSFTGTMHFVNCTSDYTDPEVTLLQCLSGTFVLRGCSFQAGGKVLYLTAGTARACDCTLAHYNSDGGATTEPAIEIAGAGTIELQGCRVLNSAVSGGAAVRITSASTSAVYHHCLFRKASGSYSIDTTVTPAVYIGACTANAALNPSITGTHDLQVDGGF